MKTAKEMFEKLGYKKYEDQDEIFYYGLLENEACQDYRMHKFIVFPDLLSKRVDCFEQYELDERRGIERTYITEEELQAIYLQAKELGWFNETKKNDEVNYRFPPTKKEPTFEELKEVIREKECPVCDFFYRGMPSHCPNCGNTFNYSYAEAEGLKGLKEWAFQVE